MGPPLLRPLAVLLLTGPLLAGCLVDRPAGMPSRPTSTTQLPSATRSTTRPPSPSPTATTPAVTRPPIVESLIPMGAQRTSEMADYSLRHYGTRTWRLTPSMIVLHYTAGDSWESARDTFAADVPNVGELPGTCSHYVVDRDGTIHAIVPVTIRCRHTIGLNDRAIGIEMVQPGRDAPGRADREILDRPAQMASALALVRWLQATYRIPATAVIGHAMANDDPRFRDLLGWRNDHVDWLAPDVVAFRERL